MHLLTDLLDSVALSDPLTYLLVFVAVSLLMLWRLESLLDHGLEGTALGTLMLPYCSGLGNLIFVALMINRKGAAAEVMTNCLVNNVTNLTLLLGLPALLWGLQVMPDMASAGAGKGKKLSRARAKPAKPAKAAKSGAGGSSTEHQINRLSLLLTLTAVFFFSGAVWLLGRDGSLNQTDGWVLIGIFLFWQCFQVFDVLKYNVRQQMRFGWRFYVDVLLVLICAYLMYESIDWLVDWLTAQKSGFFSHQNLGWLTGWLMVLPNAIFALYYAWRRRPDVVYSSQVGDGHICIPLCLGLFAVMHPVPMPAIANQALIILLLSALLHANFLLTYGGLPRWAGGVLTVAYGWFVYTGLLA